MLKICLAFWKSEPQYAHKRYAYKKHVSKCRQCKTPVTRFLYEILHFIFDKVSSEKNWRILTKIVIVLSSIAL